MAEWSGSGCRTAGLHLSRELRLHLGQHAGRQRVRCRQQMPVAIHQQQLIMPLLGEGLESGAHRRQRPGRFRCGAGMFIRRSRRSATHCASSSSWRICLSRKTSLAGKFMPRPSARIASPASSVTIRPFFPLASAARICQGWCIHTTPETAGHAWLTNGQRKWRNCTGCAARAKQTGGAWRGVFVYFWTGRAATASFAVAAR